jgi:hypothetical protein
VVSGRPALPKVHRPGRLVMSVPEEAVTDTTFEFTSGGINTMCNLPRPVQRTYTLKGREVSYMSEEHWGVFSTDDTGETWLVAIRGDEELAIEEAWRLDVEKGLTWEDNLHRVEPVPEELADAVADQLAEGEPVLVWEP